MSIKIRIRLLITIIILPLISAGCTTLKNAKDNNSIPTVTEPVSSAPDNSNKPGNTNTSSPVTVETNNEAYAEKYGYLLPNSQVKKLDDTNLMSLERKLLPFARNEIYARRGYIFTNKIYKDYFENKLWYTPDPNFNINSLSDIEKYNAELIKRIEDQYNKVKSEISPYINVYKPNTVIYLDLNNDGKKEKITYIPSKGQLIINSKVTTFHFDNPVGSFAIADIETKDKFKEVLVSDYGPSDDYRTLYYYFDGTNIVKMGETSGLFEEISFNGSGKVTAQTRGSILQTWFFNKSFKISNQHKLSEIPQELYSTNCDVTLKMQLKLYKNKGDVSPSIVINNGEKLKIIGTDNRAWCLLKTSDGTRGWIAVDRFNLIRNNGLEASDVFDGLSYAD